MTKDVSSKNGDEEAMSTEQALDFIGCLPASSSSSLYVLLLVL